MKLIQLEGGQDAFTHDLTELPMVLGRQPPRGIAIPHPTISREHARVFDRDGETFVADLNSSNGTFVNGARVSRSALNHGDVLRLGEVDLRVELGTGAATTPAAARPVSQPTSSRSVPTAAELFGEDDGITLEEATIPVSTSGTDTLISPRPFAASETMGAGFAAAPPKSVYAAAMRRPLDPKRTGTLLTADVGQQGGLRKLLTLLIALGVAAGLFYGAMRLTEDLASEGDAPGAAPTDSGDDATSAPFTDEKR